MEQFNALLIEQIKNLRCYANSLTRNTEHADDLVQDCLEKAVDRQHQWQSGTNLRAWLFTILHNLHVSKIRRINNGPSFVTMEEDEIIDSASSEEENSMNLRDLESAMAALTHEQREIIHLVCVEDMKYEDVADILEIPVGTVMSRLSRARERLRQLMFCHDAPRIRRVK